MRAFCILSMLLCLIACSGLMPKREFVNHTFYATSPKFAIRISDDLGLDDKDQSSSFNFFFSGGETGTNINEETFHFLNPKERKAFTLIISKINSGYWRSDLLDGIEHPLETGVIRAYGRNYQTAVFATKTDDGSCLFVRYLAALADASNQTLVKAYYIQEISPRLGGCENWEAADRLTSQQSIFLSSFSDDFAKDIRFVDPNRTPK